MIDDLIQWLTPEKRDIDHGPLAMLSARMTRTLLMPLLLLYACFVAGSYGAIHNQISFTVSPEYFTQYKFPQFRLTGGTSPRWDAAIVGVRASWWMGAAIGAILLPMGLVIRHPRRYFIILIQSFAVVMVTTIVVGMASLMLSYVVLSADSVGEISRYNNPIEDDLAFARAGVMHNFSYLGGIIGVLTGSGYILHAWRATWKSDVAAS